MEFEQRLQKAIERGQRNARQREEAAQRAAMTLEQLKQLHSDYRLKVSDHIEHGLVQLTQHLPGFQFESVVGENGWGGGVRRDDLELSGGRRDSLFSRLEILVRPFRDSHVIDLSAKGTVRNREIFNRNYYEKIVDADVEKFFELIDTWLVEYAELYSANH